MKAQLIIDPNQLAKLLTCPAKNVFATKWHLVAVARTIVATIGAHCAVDPLATVQGRNKSKRVPIAYFVSYRILKLPIDVVN